jgi:hypothetical protein
MESESSLPCWQQPATASYPKAHESSPYPSILFYDPFKYDNLFYT